MCVHIRQNLGDSFPGGLITFHISQYTVSFCACALRTRVHYNLQQLIWTFQTSSTELFASSLWNLSPAEFSVRGSIPLSGHIFLILFCFSWFLYYFSVAICHLFSLSSTSVIICVFWSYNLPFPWQNMLTSLLCSLRCMKSKNVSGGPPTPNPGATAPLPRVPSHVPRWRRFTLEEISMRHWNKSRSDALRTDRCSRTRGSEMDAARLRVKPTGRHQRYISCQAPA